VTGDRFAVNVGLYKGGLGGTPVGIAAVAITANATTYTQLTVPFQYVSSEVPDVVVPQFSIVSSGSGVPVHVGSFFILDDVSLVGNATAVSAAAAAAPVSFELKQNYPNPFNPSTTIAHGIPAAGNVQMKVYNSLGTEVATMIDGQQAAGHHSVVFDAAGLPSGTYFVSLRHDGQQTVRPMLLLK